MATFLASCSNGPGQSETLLLAKIDSLKSANQALADSLEQTQQAFSAELESLQLRNKALLDSLSISGTNGKNGSSENNNASKVMKEPRGVPDDASPEKRIDPSKRPKP